MLLVDIWNWDCIYSKNIKELSVLYGTRVAGGDAGGKNGSDCTTADITFIHGGWWFMMEGSEGNEHIQEIWLLFIFIHILLFIGMKRTCCIDDVIYYWWYTTY